MLLNQLSILSHPERMRVFRLLMRRCPDAVPAGEIARVLDLKPSTTSAYLSALSGAGLIDQQRDGTSRHYAVRLAGVRGLVGDLFADCCNGRPDLCPPGLVAPSGDTDSARDGKQNVLFICTGNAARSIFAEAIMRDAAGDRFNVFSAGTNPQPRLNPMAVEMLRQKGLDTATLRAKHLSEFQAADAPVMDFVFTVCDAAANEECPPWHGQPISGHWGLPDPVKATGTDAEKRLAFQSAYGAIRNRIVAFAALPMETLTRASLQHEVDAIGQTKDET
ncbi:helix-turn-helix domain-containing protein [uncultured Tateyamaria sp.]|uniref:arsenate reductase/protein-tyrosine-phosphatase family protein n=1 Tax=uncultured Tateyamaria sp. TaxID=455651 RepID=UPI0026347726|nr:helix-turn-helix domain-containing protein [uncultured Tateyamaria sp.]